MSTLAIFRDNQKWMCIDDPEHVLIASSPEEVTSVLAEVDRLTQSGMTAAGFVSYEAAGAIDSALTHHDAGNLPLACFVVGDAADAELPQPGAGVVSASDLSDELSEDAFIQAIGNIKNYLRDGDTYQVNFTHQMTGIIQVQPLEVFAQLYRAQPSPYALYLVHDDFRICSVSPELFFERDKNHIRCEPMKGTRVRGRYPLEDESNRQCLADSAKDRAENLMIVDMIRNDLGRIAKPGSVVVDRLFKIMKLPTVWQQISQVSAQTDHDLNGVFQALFPCASVTGAPRVRTMALIKELESSPRGVYTGALGVVKPGQQARFSVGIRTLTLQETEQPGSFNASYGVGGGIVWDSNPSEEWLECQSKARVLSYQQPSFQLLETMLWQRGTGVRHLDLHMNRLRRSADYFGIDIDEDRIRSDIDGVVEDKNKRLRLLVSASGEFSMEVLDVPESDEPVRLKLASSIVQSDDVFLFHKTTYRKVYEDARLEAGDRCDDVLLVNERGELTETTICNLIVEIDGQWFTPPVSSGLLAGTYRQHLIEAGRLKERVLFCSDLDSASAIYLCNSLRGIRQAKLVAN